MAVRPKTKNFLDMIIAEPKVKQADAYLQTHDIKVEGKYKQPTTKDQVRARAANNASRLVNTPQSKLYLKKHRDLAKRTKVELLGYASKNKEKLGYASLANTISEQILDRTDGKPIQSVQTHNTSLNLNIEVSKELGDKFTEFMKQSTAT